MAFLIDENRCTSPTSSAQVSAVIGPTAGMVISRSTRSTNSESRSKERTKALSVFPKRTTVSRQSRNSEHLPQHSPLATSGPNCRNVHLTTANRLLSYFRHVHNRTETRSGHCYSHAVIRWSAWRPCPLWSDCTRWSERTFAVWPLGSCPCRQVPLNERGEIMQKQLLRTAVLILGCLTCLTSATAQKTARPKATEVATG